MEQKKRKNRKRKLVFLVLLLILLQAELYCNYLFVCPMNLRRVFFTQQHFSTSPPPCTMLLRGRHVVMDNGLVRVTLSVPSGMITDINYNGGSNILDVRQRKMQRGYWDLVWSSPGQLQETFLKLRSTSFEVVVEDENQIELSFKNTYHPSSFDFNATHLPLNVDKRFVLLRGESGFYSYAIFERMEGWPALHIVQTRLTFKLNERFNYMAISDDKQRLMPTADDLRRGQRLPYIEATLLTNTSNPALKGEVDDKYQYSLSNRENQVHGWVSSNEGTSGLGCDCDCSDTNHGFWIVMPSNEFKSGGPMKQELTSHTGPTCLADFHSRHYAGKTFEGLKFEAGEAWKKVLGPVFIYLNNESEDAKPYNLWEDAKKQATKEIQKWPYDFPMSSDFPRAHQRSTVKGRLLIKDRFLKMENFPAKFGYVGLAAQGSPGSWQMEAKGYQFWIQTDNNGYFIIKNVQPGNYNLYAWIPGIFGDYKYDVNIQIKSVN